MIKERKSGVLLPVSSLPGKYGCGSFGVDAKKIIDFVKECGFTYWQVLPFAIPDEVASPYKSFSAFAGNPNFIDLESLAAKGLITAQELAAAEQKTPYATEFSRLSAERVPLLKFAASRVKNRAEVESWIENRPQLEKFCRFMAIKENNDGDVWLDWTCEEFDPETLFAWKFIQFEFHRQWAVIRAHAEKVGVKIIGDVPIYVDLDSADVWANREIFQLGADGKPTAVAGCPPDYFAEDGQLWGNPLYDWDALESNGYGWWVERMEHLLELFDGVRLDHFRGFESYWSVPAGAETAREGKWAKGPGMAIVSEFSALADKQKKLIIAEDLGDITEEVEALVSESGLPGMRVFQFGFLSDWDSTHAPHHYIENCVAYSGTHDNNTLLGYLWELPEAEKAILLEYCGYAGDFGGAIPTILRTIMQSAAGLVIFPVQDLLGYGGDTRINTPGKTDDNWSFRITWEQLSQLDKEKFHRLNYIYRRL